MKQNIPMPAQYEAQIASPFALAPQVIDLVLQYLYQGLGDLLERDARLLGLEIVSKTQDTERMLATAGAAVASKVHRVLETVKRSTKASDTTAASASKAAEEVSRHVTHTEATPTMHSGINLSLITHIFVLIFVIESTLPFSRRLVRNSSARTRLGKNEITSAMNRAHCPTLCRLFSSS